MQDFAKIPGSCAQLLKEGDTKSGMKWIRPANGIVVKVYCDMTSDNGGWTTVVEVDKKVLGKIPQLTIDDMGLTYKQVLWMSCSSHTMDYEFGESKDYVSGGYNMYLNYLKFGSRLYRVKPPVNRWTIPEGNAYIKKKNFKVLEPVPKTCTHEGKDVDVCASLFIMSVPKGKKLTGFGDIESLTGLSVGNNLYDYHFRILVR